MNFNLNHYHQYRLSELEDMIPYERDLYVGMLIQALDKNKEQPEIHASEFE